MPAGWGARVATPLKKNHKSLISWHLPKRHFSSHCRPATYVSGARFWPFSLELGFGSGAQAPSEASPRSPTPPAMARKPGQLLLIHGVGIAHPRLISYVDRFHIGDEPWMSNTHTVDERQTAGRRWGIWRYGDKFSLFPLRQRFIFQLCTKVPSSETV